MFNIHKGRSRFQIIDRSYGHLYTGISNAESQRDIVNIEEGVSDRNFHNREPEHELIREACNDLTAPVKSEKVSKTKDMALVANLGILFSQWGSRPNA
jgi:hypothetical protein